MAEPGQGAFCPSSTHPLYLVCGLQGAGKMPLLTSLLPCQELWALGEQLYFHMATGTAPFAVISLLRKDSHLVEVARLVLSIWGKELSSWEWDTGIPEELRIPVSSGRKWLYPSLRVAARWLHFVPPFLA